MDKALFARLAALPGLSPANRRDAQCKICHGQAFFFDTVDFNKCCSEADFYLYGDAEISVTYFKCGLCGFAFTDFFDSWSAKELSRFVYNDDYIKVDGEYAGPRPERDAAFVASLLQGRTDLKILDYGSGSGLLSKHLHARGFQHVLGYDPFSSPSRPRGKFDVITCFEVFEHSLNPLETVADISRFLAKDGMILFSTGLQPENIDTLRGNWWYVAPRNGHASIHTIDSLALLGQSAGLTLYAGDRGTAFGSPAVSGNAEPILASIGRRRIFAALTAPSPEDKQGDQHVGAWHGVESEDGAFYRWTGASEIAWHLGDGVMPPSELSLVLPVRMEIRPGFAEACRFKLGGSVATASRRGRHLRASLVIEEPVGQVVRLITPAPLRPCDFSESPDARPLGLAVELMVSKASRITETRTKIRGQVTGPG